MKSLMELLTEYLNGCWEAPGRGKEMYQPNTGAKCSCKRGIQRDNCPNCEGTGWVIDFRAIRERIYNEKERVFDANEKERLLERIMKGGRK